MGALLLTPFRRNAIALSNNHFWSCQVWSGDSGAIIAAGMTGPERSCQHVALGNATCASIRHRRTCSTACRDGVDDDADIAGPSGVARNAAAVPLPSVCQGGRVSPPVDAQDAPDFDIAPQELTPPNLQPAAGARNRSPLNSIMNNDMARMLGVDFSREAGARDHVMAQVCRLTLDGRCTLTSWLTSVHVLLLQLKGTVVDMSVTCVRCSVVCAAF